MERVLADHRSAPISEKEKALLDFLATVSRASPEVRSEDVAALKTLGWSEEAIYDAITVCALFNYYNRWCDAAGVGDMGPEAYLASGKRMAAKGYSHEL